MSIELHLADGVSTEITGDKLRLQQIASNLVTNALKFTPAGGTVTIATAGEGGLVELSVVDTGQGIASEFVPHLFERFSQADGSDARVHGGLGLGLSIVKNLVELHGGSVAASSEGQGRGASFRVRFAAADSPSPQPLLANSSSQASPAQEPGTTERLDNKQRHEPLADGAPPRQTPHRRLRALYVEDSDYVREQIAWMLEQEGLDLVVCANAEEADAEFRRSAFDVVITDVSLPVMSGVDLARRVLAASPQTWVVFSTGYPKGSPGHRNAKPKFHRPPSKFVLA